MCFVRGRAVRSRQRPACPAPVGRGHNSASACVPAALDNERCTGRAATRVATGCTLRRRRACCIKVTVLCVQTYSMSKFDISPPDELCLPLTVAFASSLASSGDSLGGAAESPCTYFEADVVRRW